MCAISFLFFFHWGLFAERYFCTISFSFFFLIREITEMCLLLVSVLVLLGGNQPWLWPSSRKQSVIHPGASTGWCRIADEEESRQGHSHLRTAENILMVPSWSLAFSQNAEIGNSFKGGIPILLLLFVTLCAPRTLWVFMSVLGVWGGQKSPRLSWEARLLFPTLSLISVHVPCSWWKLIQNEQHFLSRVAAHRMQSWSPTVVWVGKGFKDDPVSSPCHGQGCHSLSGGSGPIQYFQGKKWLKNWSVC